MLLSLPRMFVTGLIVMASLASVAKAQTPVITETQKLLASDGATADRFGWSVSINGDRALIGTPADDDNGDSSGSVYTLRFNGASWVEDGKLLASDGAIGARADHVRSRAARNYEQVHSDQDE